MMSALTLSAIASIVGASFNGVDRPVTGMDIDSRRVAPGDLFVALRGERVDGHDYIEAAAGRGAVAALVEQTRDASIPCLEVSDCLEALARVGEANRAAFDGTLVAMTGSCGKTSVKNMCEAIFSLSGSTVATAGNYNNEIGVPLTLGRIGDDTRFAVVEMGATRRGDIDLLCELARPSVTAVLNAMEAHLEGFGSIDDVADIKAEIYDHLGPGDTGVVNMDQGWADMWRERVTATGARFLRWSLDGPADVYPSGIDDRGLQGSAFELHIGEQVVNVTLPLPGRHNVANALVAAAMASAAGIPPQQIAEGLAGVQAEPGRLLAQRLSDGTLLIDDSYNANPGSVRAAIDLLAATPGIRTLILGEMLELGAGSAASHAEMGQRARERGLDGLVGVGAAVAPAVAAFGDGARAYADRESLMPDLEELLIGNDTILVKGSRGAAMESVIAALRQTAELRAC